MNDNDSSLSTSVPAKCIMLVEDDAITAHLLIYLIMDEFTCHILWARNIMEAWQLSKENRPNLLLLDYILPGVDGLTVYDLLRTQPEWDMIPALVLSSGPYRAVVEPHGLPFFAKPFDIDELLDQIHSLLFPT